jgi:voltage-gated potassium channel
MLTSIRVIVIFIFLGTAYQLTIKRFQEEYLMKRAVGKLDQHVIVCGFGSTGLAAVEELLLQGIDPSQIVVIATSDASLNEAADLGVVVVQGDASREATLRSVAAERAAHVMVCPGRDDTAVLITLTARDINPTANIIALCREAENVKLLERTGAQTIIRPSSAGGSLMAAATRRRHLVDTLQDMMSVGGALRLEERPVTSAEVGRRVGDLSGVLVVRVYRDAQHFNLPDFPVLEKGDTIVYVAPVTA